MKSIVSIIIAEIRYAKQASFTSSLANRFKYVIIRRASTILDDTAFGWLQQD